MENKFDKLETLRNRLLKIGIEITFAGNYPWIYLHTVNGKRITEKTDDSNHGFNIAFLPINPNKTLTLRNTKEMFKIIRKYGKVHD